MPRMARMKYSDPKEGHYHIISRTVLKAFLLKKREKEYFLKLLKKMARVYFVKIETFSVMSNHFHLIIQMIPEDDITDFELRKRFEIYYNEGVPKKWQRVYYKSLAPRLRRRWSDVSIFVQDLKQRFSRWYNKLNDGHGHIWSERFKSILLESNQALLACMAYVELNSVRAGIVKKPEEYRYSGLAHMVTGGRASNWLDNKALRQVLSEEIEGKETDKKILQYYLTFVYSSGMIERDGKARISGKEAEFWVKEKFKDFNIFSFQRRVRFFSEGIILGSKSFCDNKFHEFRSYFQGKKERSGKPVLSTSSLKLYSIKSFYQT